MRRQRALEEPFFFWRGSVAAVFGRETSVFDLTLVVLLPPMDLKKNKRSFVLKSVSVAGCDM